MGTKRELPVKATSKKKSEIPPKLLREVKGLLLLALDVLLVLCLVSFSFQNPSSNWLGLMGYCIGWTFMYTFGLASYLILIYIGWTGWQLLCNKPLEHYPLKTFYFCVMLGALCVLLNILADTQPSLSAFFHKIVYTEAMIVHDPWPYHQMRYNLGGVPIYFLFADLPVMSLQHLLSNVGTTLVFSLFFVVSFLLLTETLLKRILDYISKQLPSAKEELSKEPPGSAEASPSLWQRFVSLLAPEPALPEQSRSIRGASLLEFDDEPLSRALLRPSLAIEKDRQFSPFFPDPETFLSKPSSQVPKSLGAIIDPPPRKSAPPASKEALSRPAAAPLSNYQPPPLSLLTQGASIDPQLMKKDLLRQAKLLEETLLSFGIEAKVGDINCGPTITSFEVHPAVGVKVQKIKTLADDIALNMEAKSIRILAPIPGKAAVGVEVPNPRSGEVSFKEMLSTYQKSSNKLHIPILLGKTVNGDNVAYDLVKMPHCIIAGATGSGKSVCINTIVMSILMNAAPDEVKLLMIDPKKVELTAYNDLPHMIAPVITEPEATYTALKWLVKEMERRYEILKQVGVRHIVAFNHRKPDLELEKAISGEIPLRMFYIVAIIDELADLMMVSASDIETPIARIAQMARAVGIHLIIATQRPSREVITGLIKANFPVRIAFKVASRINSQIILDETGAETLLGNGDMLFLPPGSSHLIRAQGAFVRDEDINRVVAFICKQMPPNYLIPSFAELNEREQENASFAKESDSLYQQAFDIVISTGNASTTFLQRKLKIGYARAASLMDQLEHNGIVGPADGAKPRKIKAESRKSPEQP